MASDKLYPPQLEGSLPAFYKDYSIENGKERLTGCTINIPFGINRAVNMKTIDKLVLRLRTTSTNTYIVADYPSTNYDTVNHIASFKFVYDEDDENTNTVAYRLNEGQYYRVQIAFVKDDVIGYYSTVGIIKCVAKPSAQIGATIGDGGLLSVDEINQFDDLFYGVYKQDTRFGDSTEKAYSYKFELFDSLNQLVLTSGEKIHDITQDTLSDTSQDYWHIYYELPEDEIYKIRYTVTTLNGLTISSIDYRVIRVMSVDCQYYNKNPRLSLRIYAEANYENGYIDITLQGPVMEKQSENDFLYIPLSHDVEYSDTLECFMKVNNEYVPYEPTPGLSDEEMIIQWMNMRDNDRVFIRQYVVNVGEQYCPGQFVITRASSKDNYQEWLQIVPFTLDNNILPSEFHYPDYTVEQGIEYKYAIQQMNVHNVKSKKIYQRDKNGYDVAVRADFEDMFLSDGIRQLKIRYNPKVSSFKNSIPEQKIETIGSKYPFIFRNGQVCYKEFPIAGLISFQMDDALLFFNQHPDELEQAKILIYDEQEIAEGKKTFNEVIKEAQNSQGGYQRIASNLDNYHYITGHDGTLYKVQELKIPVWYYDALTHRNQFCGYRHVITDYNIRQSRIIRHDHSKTYIPKNTERFLGAILRDDRTLTDENIYSERYFKLKVLDWLTDGNVKFFRSSTEGNYLVRLLNVSLTPQDPLGRMLHQFTCTAYEVDEITNENVLKYGITTTKPFHQIYEAQWASVDVNELTRQNDADKNGWIRIFPNGVIIDKVEIQDFAAGDQIKVVYSSGADGIFTIGVTGTLELNNDDRRIIDLYLKPNPLVNNYNDFSRTLLYQTTDLKLTEFDAIKNYTTHIQVAEQFIGPTDNLLEPYILRDNVYGVKNEDGFVENPLTEDAAFRNVREDLGAHRHFTYMINEKVKKITALSIDILHVNKKEVIPIYCYTGYLASEPKYGITPFGIPYVNGKDIMEYTLPPRHIQINYLQDNELMFYEDENGNIIKANGVRIEDISKILEDAGMSYNTYDLLEPFYYDHNDNIWKSFQEYDPMLVNGYFDLYTKEWMDPHEIYDPTFSINDLQEFPNNGDYYDYANIGSNKISLLEVNDITLKNINMPEKLQLGNGVVAEITVRFHIVDYDIEDSEPSTKLWKDTYLNLREQLNPTIDMAMKHVEDINAAEIEKAKILITLQEIKKQIEIYETGVSATTGVMDIARSRIQKQKQKIWDTLKKQIEDILNILKQQQVYLNLSGGSNNIIAALRTYSYNATNAQAQSEENYYENRELNNTNNILYLKPSSNSDKNITINGKTHNLVDDVYLFYQPQYEIARDNALSILNKCNAQLNNLAVQAGNIIGGYLQDYNEENPPPENTLVYAQYQIATITQKLEEIYDRALDVKSPYIYELFGQLIIALNDSLDDTTDSYIINNANTLKTILNTYKATLQSNRDTILSNEGNTETVDSLIETVTNEIAALDTIIEGNWQKKRASDKRITDFTLSDNDKNTLSRIEQSYINSIKQQIEPNLAGKTLDDVLSLTNSNPTNKDRIKAILKLLADIYNKDQKDTILTDLNKYYYKYQTTQQNADDRVSQIIQIISDIDGAYQAKKRELENQRNVYIEEEAKFRTQLKEIETTQAAIEQTRNAAQQDYDRAQKELDDGIAAQQAHDTETGDLFDVLVSEETANEHNVQYSIDYMDWLEHNQKELLNQIGQIFSNLEKGSDYANMLLTYINAYEDEAFKFLHFYDAIIEDLHLGIAGTDGVDWLYQQLNNYWLSSYKDIFFLTNQTRWTNHQHTHSLPTSIINDLESSDEATRKDMYEELRTNLELSLLEAEPNVIQLSVLQRANENNTYSYRLVKILNDNNDLIYPNIYEVDDTDYFRPLRLRYNESLLRDTVTSNAVGQLREVQSELDEYNSTRYIKDPRAKGFYTNNSTIDHLVPVFNKPVDQIQDQEFQTACQQAASIGKPILWLTDNPPVSIIVQFHKNLFTNFNYPYSYQNIGSNPNAFLITPSYYSYFDHMLGLIIHENRNNMEYGSWMGLREIDTTIWPEVAKCFYDWVQFSTKTVANETMITEYEELNTLIKNYTSQVEYYTRIIQECETVLESYRAQQITNDAPEMQQLSILLDTANEELDYYQKQLAVFETELTNLLDNNIDFKEYILYTQTIPDSIHNINVLKDNYIQQYQIYKNKVNHYLYLIFNNEPYGHRIDTSVVQNEELLHLGENSTDMYNLGIAYAIESYKLYKDDDTPINFDTIVTSINDLNYLLNNDFEFVYPIPKYNKVNVGTAYRATTQYYTLGIEKYTYDPYVYIDNETWLNDLEEQKVYIYANNLDYTATYNTGWFFFIRDNDKFSEYRYTTQDQWKKDRENLDLWYTKYPNLVDFALRKTYRPINELDSYDPNIYYYSKIDNEYTIIEVTPETWKYYSVDNPLYIEVGNGGLKGFLKNLLTESDYLNEIKEIYIGTIKLYFSLLAESLGDTTSIDNLRQLLIKNQVRLKELDEIIKYKDQTFIDVNAKISDIYDALAWYFVSLTNAYIELVERSYGVV